MSIHAHAKLSSSGDFWLALHAFLYASGPDVGELTSLVVREGFNWWMDEGVAVDADWRDNMTPKTATACVPEARVDRRRRRRRQLSLRVRKWHQ